MKYSAPAEGFRIAYDRMGSGKPVVLLHGWPGDRTDYNALAPILAQHADVIVPDLRGFGQSDKHLVEPETVYSAPGQAKGVIALMDELGLKSAVLGGIRCREPNRPNGCQYATRSCVSPGGFAAFTGRREPYPGPQGGEGILVHNLPPAKGGRRTTRREARSDPRLSQAFLVALVRAEVRRGRATTEPSRRGLLAEGRFYRVVGLV